jgi:hypothetical protein
MTLSDLTSAEELKAEALSNPAVRAEWDRTAMAREVASRVVLPRRARAVADRAGCQARGLAAVCGAARER